MNFIINRYKVIKEYISPYPDSIIFKKGEIVKPGKEYTDNPNWKNWIWCEGQSNNKAWVPKQYISIENKKCIFKEEYDALEISVLAGEELLIYEEINGFVKAEKANGEIGWVPFENLKFSENK